MEKKKIVIVECISSSANYIRDIVDEGYEPVLMELPVPEKERQISRIWHDLCIDAFYLSLYPDAKPPRIIQASENYEENLEMVRELDPVLVLPGGDEGVIIATRLSHDLGLVSNDPENLPKMRCKSVAQEMLRQNGIRSIYGKTVSTLEEALEFYQSLGSDRIVIKPIDGGASVGVHICDDRAGLEEAFFGDIASARDRNGDSAEVLVQEYIDGDEYVVNTVSCRGVHKVTGVMVYKKILLPEMAPLYYTMSTFSPESDEARQVIDYTLKALDAIGVEYGPVHSEIMIDEKGPVLIEANCRLCGATMLASWQDKVFGERESRTSLRAYLHPERFLSDTRRILMDAELTGIIRFLILEKEMFVRKNKVAEAFSGIEGFEYAFGMGDGRLYPKTVDLSTTGGMVYLAHRSREALQNSLELIRKIELEEPERIYDV